MGDSHLGLSFMIDFQSLEECELTCAYISVEVELKILKSISKHRNQVSYLLIEADQTPDNCVLNRELRIFAPHTSGAHLFCNIS